MKHSACWSVLLALGAATTTIADVPDVYEVDSQSSSAHILVYRGGKLARIGHDHVVSVVGLTGHIWIDPTIERSGFELSFPVARLLVDDPDARRAFGPDFREAVPDIDRAGTRRNMLRSAVLDSVHYPVVTLRSLAVAGPLQAPQVSVRITIKDGARDITVVPQIQLNGARMTASGELDIYQSDFGIRPFNVLLATLEVEDRLRVRFSVSAVKREDPAAASP